MPNHANVSWTPVTGCTFAYDCKLADTSVETVDTGALMVQSIFYDFANESSQGFSILNGICWLYHIFENIRREYTLIFDFLWY